MPGDTQVTVVGWSGCGFFQSAVRATTEAEQRNPQLRATLVELVDRAAYQAWLQTEKPKLNLSGGENHTSSPLVYLNDNEFLGGCDAVLAYLNKSFGKKVSKDKKSGVLKYLKLAGITILGAIPLVLSSARQEPLLTAVGLVLQGLLTKDTVAPKPSSKVSLDEGREESAKKKLIITTDNNRLIRIGMGGTHLYAAFKMASRWSASEQSQSLAYYSLDLLGLFGLVYYSFIWSVSGYYGQ